MRRIFQGIKLVVFDLDGTLAELGRPVASDNAEKLRRIEGRAELAISSGKPAYYLCGFARQLGLKRPLLIGENGCAMQLGVKLPPEREFSLCSSEKALGQLRFAREGIAALFEGGIWFQPNCVMVTPFPRGAEEFEKIRRFLSMNAEKLDALDVYEHCDSFDIVPKGIDKRSSLEYAAALRGLTPAEILPVGDGVNDYPMFGYAETSIGIRAGERAKVTYDFANIGEALDFILNNL